ncbi:hypothetical protein J6590_102022 [Homalodisca vitripennis]|nr:hypothetical protein J6590_102022 [Homalodisca vitripennis]
MSARVLALQGYVGHKSSPWAVRAIRHSDLLTSSPPDHPLHNYPPSTHEGEIRQVINSLQERSIKIYLPLEYVVDDGRFERVVKFGHNCYRYVTKCIMFRESKCTLFVREAFKELQLLTLPCFYILETTLFCMSKCALTTGRDIHMYETHVGELTTELGDTERLCMNANPRKRVFISSTDCPIH